MHVVLGGKLWSDREHQKVIFMPKTKPENPLKMNKKMLLKLLSKREAVQKEIQKSQRRLEKINQQISSFRDWLKNLPSGKININ